MLDDLLNKVWYFKCGSKDVRVAIPHSTMGRILVGVFAVLTVWDLLMGNLVGAFLMFLFLALNTVDIK